MASSVLYNMPGHALSSSPRRLGLRSPWVVPMLVLACLASQTMAAVPAAITPPADLVLPPVQTLVMDTRLPVMVRGHWELLSEQERELRKRQNDNSDPTPTAVTSPSSAEPEETRSGRQTTLTVSVTVPTTSVDPPTPLPSPFDGNLAYNFTGSDGSSCPRFINDLLISPTFKRCYPLSMMLQGSTSFFEAQRKLVSIVRVLDASCSADVNFCTSFMRAAAKNLTADANCGSDYRLENPIVVQAYLGLTAYEMLYAATCLQDPQTSMYCFANAVTNLTTPSNVYFYYLPLNMTLPGSATPSCSWCMRETMGIFQSATADRRQAIAWTYAAASKQVNTICGPNFTNSTLPAPIISNMAGLSLPSWTLALVAAFFAVAANWL